MGFEIPRIRELSDETINQIAAGEILERPSQLVKELLENSLDAGSKKIRLEAFNGGRSLRLVDDGIGILKEDLPAAFKRHATSKIKKFEDLQSVSTYGFRGEALASLAAVAQVEIASKALGQDHGFRMSLEFGQTQKIEEVEMGFGTDLKIESLFENVPARLKFLKSESAEIQQIKNAVKAVALARPDVEFTFVEKGNLALHFLPQTASERIEKVLGVSPMHSCLSEEEGEHLEIHFSSPNDVQKSSRQIWLFVDGRWVQDRTLQAAILDAYRNLLMHGEYPSIALFLRTQSGSVDVNVHPAKTQIKFANSQRIYKWVRDTLAKALAVAPWNAHGVMARDFRTANLSRNFETQQKFSLPEQVQFKTKQYEAPIVDSLRQNEIIFEKPSQKIQGQTAIQNLDYRAPVFRTEMSEQNKVEKDFDSKSLPGEALNSETKKIWSSRQILGQLRLTYLVCQDDLGLSLIDQHAAHERVIFERLVDQWRTGHFRVQSFLFPLIVDLSVEAVEILMRNAAHLQKMGIEIEQMGPSSLGIRSAPEHVADQALAGAIQKMAEDFLQHDGSAAVEEKVFERFASLACHSALRAGQSLCTQEMQTLLHEMDEHPLSSHCPHGRPVEFRLSWIEIEKKFGRIL